MFACFLCYGALFFDRLAPLYLIAFVTDDLPVREGGDGILALSIGVGWAASMALAHWSSGRWSNRQRVLVATAGAATFGLASLFAPAWTAFCALRGLGGLFAGTAAPPITALTFAASPSRRRGLDLGIVQASTRMFGSLAAPVVVTTVAVWQGWTAALATSTAFVALGAVVLATLVPTRPRPARPAAARDGALTYRPAGRRNVALCAVVSAALVAWLITTSQSAVPLVEQWLGVGPSAAGRVVGWFGVGAAGAALIVPIASDWVGRHQSLSVATLVGAAGGLTMVYAAANGMWASGAVASVLMAVAGVAMGGLPLVISIIPAEAVATGEVGRALVLPIVAAELVGGAAVPALAAAAVPAVGLPVAVGGTALGLVLAAVLGMAMTTAGEGVAAA